MIEDGVLEEVRKISMHPRVRVEQRLYHDLMITGEDAGELLDNIHRRFGTTLKGFAFHTYFSNEPDLVTSLFERIFKSTIKEKPITIGHLIEVVRRGYWFDP